jgi:hypothetical protein
MRLLQIGMRIWIAVTSVFSFMAGWIMLAHSPKPVQSASTSSAAPSGMSAPVPTLAPLPPLDLSGTQNQAALPAPQFSVQQQPSFFSQAPVFTTGGS